MYSCKFQGCCLSLASTMHWLLLLWCFSTFTIQSLMTAQSTKSSSASTLSYASPSPLFPSCRRYRYRCGKCIPKCWMPRSRSCKKLKVFIVIEFVKCDPFGAVQRLPLSLQSVEALGLNFLVVFITQYFSYFGS